MRSRDFGKSRSPSRRDDDEDDAEGEPGVALVSLGALIHTALALKTSLARKISHLAPALKRMSPTLAQKRLAFCGRTISTSRREPVFDDDDARWSLCARRRIRACLQRAWPSRSARSSKASASRAKSSRRCSTAEPSTRRPMNCRLCCCSPSQRSPPPSAKISQDALEQNARLLEGVLDDFSRQGRDPQCAPRSGRDAL